MTDKEGFQFSRVAEELIGDLRGIHFNEPARMRRRPTKDISGLIQELIVKYQVGQNSPESQIREHWSEFVGHANAAYSHPVAIDPKGKLMILVSHSVVRGELYHHKARILAEVKKLPGCAHVKDVHFRAG